jgi:hypothetical protein
MSDTVAYMIIGVVLIPFAIAALKGHAWKSFIGLLILFFLSRIPIIGLLALIPLGLAIYRSFAWATPDSLWARMFYDAEKQRSAEEHHAEKSKPTENERRASDPVETGLEGSRRLALGSTPDEGLAPESSTGIDTGGRSSQPSSASQESQQPSGDRDSDEAELSLDITPDPGWYQSPFEPWRKQYWDGTTWGELEQVICPDCAQPLTGPTCSSCHI